MQVVARTTQPNSRNSMHFTLQTQLNQPVGAYPRPTSIDVLFLGGLPKWSYLDCNPVTLCLCYSQNIDTFAERSHDPMAMHLIWDQSGGKRFWVGDNLSLLADGGLRVDPKDLLRVTANQPKLINQKVTKRRAKTRKPGCNDGKSSVRWSWNQDLMTWRS